MLSIQDICRTLAMKSLRIWIGVDVIAHDHEHFMVNISTLLSTTSVSSSADCAGYHQKEENLAWKLCFLYNFKFTKPTKFYQLLTNWKCRRRRNVFEQNFLFVAHFVSGSRPSWYHNASELKKVFHPPELQNLIEMLTLVNDSSHGLRCIKVSRLGLLSNWTSSHEPLWTVS